MTKICIVGAGSSYTPELIKGLLACKAERLDVSEIRLFDLDAERLNVMAGLSSRMIEHAGRDIALTSSQKLDPMLEGVDFVVTQIRVGGMRARHIDESIPLEHGVIGQETTGPGGMMKALRTIPAMLEIAHGVERVCPDAFILNYTNPSGIVTEAVRRHSNAKLIGLCSGIPGIRGRIRELLEDEFGETASFCVGLNHLGFVHRIVAGGEDVSERAMTYLAELAERDEDAGVPASGEIIRLFGAVPIGYIHWYADRRAALGRALLQEKTRAQQIMEIEARTLAEAADPSRAAPPEALDERGGGGYADVTFAFMRAIVHDSNAELACTVLNEGAVEGLPDDAGVEIVCRVGRHGAAPLPVGRMPLAFRGLVQAVKAYETLTVQAAVEKRRDLVVRGLVAHPLVGDLAVANALADEMLAAHGLEFS